MQETRGKIFFVAYRENVASQQRTLEGFTRLRSGNVDIYDAPCSDRHTSCQEVVEALRITNVKVWNHLRKAD